MHYEYEDENKINIKIFLHELIEEYIDMHNNNLHSSLSSSNNNSIIIQYLRVNKRVHNNKS